MSTPLPICIPLTKIDVEKREVYGFAALQVGDLAGEIVDIDSSLPHFQALEKRCLAESGGKKVAPLREMHQLRAIGNVTEFTVDPLAKTIAARSRVTDDAAWSKVLDGTLCCYSMGGKKDILGPSPSDPRLRRYTAKPSELSLVDLGAIPGTGIALLNAAGTQEILQPDGTVETRPYVGLEKVAKREDVKPAEGADKYGDVSFADAKNKKYPIDTVAHIRAAWNYINKPANAGKYSAKDATAIKRKIVSAWKAKIDSAGPPSAEKAATAETLKKNLGFEVVSRLADILSTLDYLLDAAESEAAAEGDDSAVPAQLATAIQTLGDVLVAMAAEEVGELADDEPEDALNVENPGDEGVPIALAKADAMRGMKKRVQAMHDCAVDMGAACKTMTAAAGAAPTEEDAMEAGELKKAVGEALTEALGSAESPLMKAIGTAITAGLEVGLTKVADTLNKTAAKVVEVADKQTALEAKLAETDALLAKVAATPAAPKGIVLAVEKGEDTGGTGARPATDALAKAVEAKDADAVIRAIHRSGGRTVTLQGIRDGVPVGQ